MDWGFIVKHVPQYIDAMYLTLALAIGGIALSFIIGIICSSILYFKVKILRKIINIYIELSRNTPLLMRALKKCPSVN